MLNKLVKINLARHSHLIGDKPERERRESMRRRALLDTLALVLLVAFCAVVAWLMLAVTS